MNKYAGAARGHATPANHGKVFPDMERRRERYEETPTRPCTCRHKLKPYVWAAQTWTIEEHQNPIIPDASQWSNPNPNFLFKSYPLTCAQPECKDKSNRTPPRSLQTPSPLSYASSAPRRDSSYLPQVKESPITESRVVRISYNLNPNLNPNSIVNMTVQPLVRG